MNIDILKKLLEELVDSLEYVDKAHPELLITGYAVRAERIEKAKKYLKDLG